MLRRPGWVIVGRAAALLPRVPTRYTGKSVRRDARFAAATEWCLVHPADTSSACCSCRRMDQAGVKAAGVAVRVAQDLVRGAAVAVRVAPVEEMADWVEARAALDKVRSY